MKRVNAFDIATAQHWAMTEPALRQLLAIAQRQGDWQALEAVISDELEGAERATVRHGVAIITIRGPLFRYANLFTRISGATSYDVVAKDLTTALATQDVHSVLLNIDSPGGEVNGTHELSEMIYAARAVKPVVAYVGGMAASGGYWLASAAERVIVDETAILGSIGVIWAAMDTSKAEEKAGLREIVIVSDQSPHKDTDPATDDGFDRMRILATQLADVFIRSVARNRGVDEATVINDFGRGWVKTGQEVLDVKLADEFGSFESTLAQMIERGKPAPRSAITPLRRMSMATDSQGPAAAQDEPVVAPTITQEQLDAAVASAREDAIKAENARIAALEAAALPGHEQLLAAAKADPSITVEAFMAQQISAEQQAAGRTLRTIQRDEEELNAPPAAAAPDVEAGEAQPSGSSIGTPNRAKVNRILTAGQRVRE